MYCGTLPQEYHVKDLIEKELPRKIHRGRGMLISPNPLEEREEFKDHVCNTVCYCGIHSHDAHCSGTYHKLRKGIEGCQMDKPINLLEKTKPVKLVDMTQESEMRGGEISYKVESN